MVPQADASQNVAQLSLHSAQENMLYLFCFKEAEKQMKQTSNYQYGKLLPGKIFPW